MEDFSVHDAHPSYVLLHNTETPPSPPCTEDNASDASGSCEALDIPLPPPTTVPTKILDIDKNTPDSHVPRDSRLIRLTGIHPFNVEAPLSALYDEGFLTTQELFYVRNHGPVPAVDDQDVPDWQLTVEGMVEKPLTLTLRQLISDYEQITCPITLVCAGNRRKEQNQVRKSQGFSWGAAGVSTALFTGVAMGDLIKKARPRRGARFVCMEGADMLPNGFYGTSVKLNCVVDPNRGMMLAYKMNGEMLRPDHGKPLRAVIPGQMGGRSVKWLKKLVVTKAASDNWYHIYDNRVLPTMISPEESANNSKWWKDERYAIYDLSTNSAIVYPAHDEAVSLTEGSGTYRTKGYAYGGGGRRITRVEISLDKGCSWRLADIEYPEDRYRNVERNIFGGRLNVLWRESSFCWCFWTLSIPLSDLSQAKDIVVRAMDESMNVQPKDMYWNVLGMMNNPWFRVTIRKEANSLKFEHPTQPALIPGGWMQRVKDLGGDLTDGHWGESLEPKQGMAIVKTENKEVMMTKEDLKKTITIDELKKHEDDQDPWFVVNGEVYEGASFMEKHPGGAQSIISAAGLDCSDEFLAIHSETAKSMMPAYHLGTLDENSKLALNDDENRAKESDASSPTFLKPQSWKKVVLHAKRSISWDTQIFTFKLEHQNQTNGLPGQHLLLRLRDLITRETIIRPYTPLHSTCRKGYMDILIKLYLDTSQRKGGKMSQALNAFPIGQAAHFKGPLGKFKYLGRGYCSINNTKQKFDRFGMICAGSGITPLYQIIHAIMNDSSDQTKCTLLNSNRMVGDILCREDLDAFATEKKTKVVHTLTQATGAWEGERGRIDKRLIKKCFDDGDEGMLMLVCGPEGLEDSVDIALKELGWPGERIFLF